MVSCISLFVIGHLCRHAAGGQVCDWSRLLLVYGLAVLTADHNSVKPSASRLEKNLGFSKTVFRFLGFLGFFVQRPNTTVRPKSTRERKTSHTWYALPLLTDYSVQNYKHQALPRAQPRF